MSVAAERGGCALVTGASRGIGSAIACALAADGWPVGVNFREGENAASETVTRIEDGGGRAMALRADVTAAHQLENMFDTLEQRFGRVLVLVNNAGVRADALAISLQDSDWGRVIDTNLTASFRATRRALRGMIRERFGRVINLALVVGPRADPGAVQLRRREGRPDRHDEDDRRGGGPSRRDRQRDRAGPDRNRYDG